jgi:hypothetical protein
MKVLLWLLRMIFPNAGWYLDASADFDLPARIGPFSDYCDAKSWETDSDYFNVVVRFRLW